MYGVVLMTALATSTATPTWGCHRAQCYSAPACSGYGGYSCYSGYSGYGCQGGCYGYAPRPGYGAAGGCYGYHGGCYGAFGNYYVDPYSVSNGCYGCYGGYSCYGVPLPGSAPVVKTPAKDPFPPINPDVKKDPKEEEINPLKEKKPADKKKKDLEESVRVKVRIEVPEGGKLFVDGRPINVGAGTRVFQTPPLAAGETYFYDIRIEIGDRSEQQRVIIQPGQDALVSFPTLRPTGPNTAQLRR